MDFIPCPCEHPRLRRSFHLNKEKNTIMPQDAHDPLSDISFVEAVASVVTSNYDDSAVVVTAARLLPLNDIWECP